jgi:hypothetical protein
LLYVDITASNLPTNNSCRNFMPYLMKWRIWILLSRYKGFFFSDIQPLVLLRQLSLHSIIITRANSEERFSYDSKRTTWCQKRQINITHLLAGHIARDTHYSLHEIRNSRFEAKTVVKMKIIWVTPEVTHHSTTIRQLLPSFMCLTPCIIWQFIGEK